ncbi:YveK family protein [Streptococcus suis]|uniref:YveK family protein n=1 Tax=Streptococcus suis TaxID=1307 RepID=UPI00211D2961|nr:Wzz/FepE/Etk N-terminal domain-containing protein [Streptococcus suis]UUM58050.1 Wzz/FepE/Etk N-terminal domain-containing protein [Streptococcus suis]
MNKQIDDFIDIFELIALFKKNIVIIAICSLIGGAFMGLYASLAVTPQYASSAQLLVTPQYASSAQLLVAQDPIDVGNQNAYVSAADSIRINLEMIPTYRDILFGVPVLGKVADSFGGKYPDYYLKERLTFTQTKDSQAFVVNLRMDDAQEAQAVLEEITTVFSDTLQDIYSEGFGKVVVLSPASYNANKVSPSIIKNVVTGILAGIFLSFGFIISRNLFDRTVKNDAYLQAQNLTLLTELHDMTASEISNAHYKLNK